MPNKTEHMLGHVPMGSRSEPLWAVIKKNKNSKLGKVRVSCLVLVNTLTIYLDQSIWHWKFPERVSNCITEPRNWNFDLRIQKELFWDFSTSSPTKIVCITMILSRN